MSIKREFGEMSRDELDRYFEDLKKYPDGMPDRAYTLEESVLADRICDHVGVPEIFRDWKVKE